MGERILVLDGAMGTMIQRERLDEAQFRGERFRDWPRDLKGNNDLLALTQPGLIRRIHEQYLEAGADILETNTFNSTAVSMADYGMEAQVAELNLGAARLAVAAARSWEAKDPSRPRFVAGVLGPTTKTASISPDVNDPGFRAISFDQLAAAYSEAAQALAEGGVDLFLIETVFDTLNAKAALFALEELFERRGARLAGDRLRHHHRRLGPHALGADHRGVLQLRAPHAAAGRRPQLRARREGTSSPRRRAVRGRRSLRFLPPERRPAKRIRRVRRHAGEHGGADGRVGAQRVAQHHRRLLRHHGRAHPRAGTGSEGRGAAARAATAEEAAPGGPRAAQRRR